jgi:ubiquitin-protein ligase
MAVPASKLNKALYTDVTKLKLLTPTSTPTKFKFLKSPFDDDDEDEGAAATPKAIIITGQIFPNSEVFKQGSYEIEMKLTSSYPFEPPEVRFVTPIYHPNVDQKGKRKNEKN